MVTVENSFWTKRLYVRIPRNLVNPHIISEYDDCGEFCFLFFVFGGELNERELESGEKIRVGIT